MNKIINEIDPAIRKLNYWIKFDNHSLHHTQKENEILIKKAKSTIQYGGDLEQLLKEINQQLKEKQSDHYRNTLLYVQAIIEQIYLKKEIRKLSH